MTLHSDLHELAADQPTQPIDRLSSVTRKARRIRQARVAMSMTAALALLAPAGILLANRESDAHSTTRFASTSVSTWTDRSTTADRAVAEGAVQQWRSSGGTVTDLHWLYRGLVDVPDGAPLYVAAWTANGRVVMGSVERSTVDAQGAAEGKTPWRLADEALDRAPELLTLYLPQIADGETGNNWMFVLADPRARTLRWTAVPLTAAPARTDIVDAGVLRSDDGVFQGLTGPITGMLRATVDESSAAPALLTFPDAEPRLAPVDDLTALRSGSIAGTAGQVTDGQVSDTEPTSAADDLTAVVVRCYGGGSLTLLLDGTVTGTAPCDLRPHVVALHAIRGVRHHLQVRGERLQVYLVTTT